ncbi:HWE histidine kinase domain-containing protein [Sabulicella rubraurantiaca]|uniref:HWE histidine kinase domain-containing protein n=1 Tax=Sabulicella rubraurantiaca TaxID=2811429 RepID=UPI001A97C83B|nr:HWE histidine kinase domain-containing protein [Sabulicella rubraurantiaca]
MTSLLLLLPLATVALLLAWNRALKREMAEVARQIKRTEAAAKEAAASKERGEQARLLLAQEVDHRAKNLLGVVQGLVTLTPSDDPACFKRSVTERIQALSRVHCLLADHGWGHATLRRIAERELAAYLAGNDEAVTIEGPEVFLSAIVVQPVAMVLHELATNALKYGALSAAQGRVQLRWTLREGWIALDWVECGGPPPCAVPGRHGIGSTLIDGIVRDQLMGQIDCRWEETGLVCKIHFPLANRLDSAATERQYAFESPGKEAGSRALALTDRI